MNTQQLLSAIVARLSAVSAVTTGLGTVPGGYQTHAIYTDVPQDAQSEDAARFPYISVSLATGSPNDTKDDNGGEVLVDVHLWTRGKSTSERMAKADAIYDALQLHSLSVSGANVIECRFDSSQDLKDPDGLTAHVVLTWRVLYFLT